MNVAAQTEDVVAPVRSAPKRKRWPFRLTILGAAIASVALWAGIVALFNMH